MKEQNIFTKIRVYTIDECSGEKKSLIEAAKIASSRAYAPYSHFHVGAALLLENGEVICGSNQENAAYPTTLCAERTAIFYANSQYPEVAVKAVAVAAFANGDFTEEPCVPCGSCRQVISEVENRYGRPVEVLMYGRKHIYVVDSVQALLPLSFGREQLPGG